jgi:Family of unknown function (DUF6200)
MATAPSTPEQRESREQEKGSRSQIVIVDFGEAQPSQQVKRLRKGRGKLVTKVERIINDLVTANTVKSGAQPVVIVVRELPSLWPFDDDDDDDDD